MLTKVIPDSKTRTTRTPGDLLISGTFTSPANRLYAISNLDNNPDTTINTNIGSGLNNYVWDGALYNDKVLLYGFFTTYGSETAPYFAEINRNGTFSRTGLGSGFNGSVRAVIVQPDGKLICAGTFTSYNTLGVNRIVRLNPDFTVDATFNVGSGIPSGEVNSMVTDGTNIYLVGTFTTYNGTTRNRFVKIRMSDGADVTGTNSGFNNNTFGIAIYGDHLYIGGENFTSFNGTTVPQNLCKIHKDTLVPDSTFSTNFAGGVNARVLSTISVDSQYVYFNGNFSSPKANFARVSHNGTLDASFPKVSPSGNVLYHRFIRNSTKIAIAGTFTLFNGNANGNRFGVYDTTVGSVDTNFYVNLNNIGTFVIEF
jgi:hypothetical protein